MSDIEQLKKMRDPFPANLISKLPKETKAQNDARKADRNQGINCDICGGWHHKHAIHLDYVGHAALTDRLLDTDIEWSWEPVAFNADGLPSFDRNGGLWIRLTVQGVTRLGYGAADGKSGGDAIKEIIGDALRNAAMRFGAALDLWHKGDLHAEETDEVVDNLGGAKPSSQPPRLKGLYKTRAEVKTHYGEVVREINAAADMDSFETYLVTQQDFFHQLQTELRHLWEGDGADFIGMRAEIQKARDALDLELDDQTVRGERLVDTFRAG